MPHRRYIPTAIALISCLAVPACGKRLIRQNPQAFDMAISQNQLTGKYNPEGFNAEEVQKLLASNCASNMLGSFNEYPDSKGQMAFGATCEGALTVPDGKMKVERVGNQAIIKGSTYNQNGEKSRGSRNIAL